MERFIAYLIETYKGCVPIWLAPHQATVIPISNEAHAGLRLKVAKELRNRGVRDVDERNEKCNTRFVKVKLIKFLYQLIVGDLRNKQMVR